MPTLQPIYIVLLVYGAGVLAVDFLGAFSHGGGGHHGSAHQGGAHQGGHHETSHQDRGEERQDALASPAPAESAANLISRIASALRLSVYFAMGAGAMGLISVWRAIPPAPGLAWSVGTGLVAAAASRLVRGLARKELDSSFRSEEFLMEEAEVVVGADPGLMGKAELRKFGANVEIYVKAADPSLALLKGARVRIVEASEELCLVEPVSGPPGE
jgi:hypothetical protein